MKKDTMSSHWMESQYSPSYREADMASLFLVGDSQDIWKSEKKKHYQINNHSAMKWWIMRDTECLQAHEGSASCPELTRTDLKNPNLLELKYLWWKQAKTGAFCTWILN